MTVWSFLQRRHFSRLPTISHVPRVENPPWEVFNTYFVQRAAPVIITGSPLFSGRNLTLDGLTRPGPGDIPVSVRSGNYLNIKERRYEEMPLSRYIEEHIRPWEQGAATAADGSALPHYSGNTPLTWEQFEALGLKAPQCFDGQKFDAPRLWFGPKGSATPLHYDSRDNLICQYIGRKHFILFAPSQIPWLYMRDYSPAWSSISDPRKVDLNKFPLFARAKAVEVTLNAGEMLYLPEHWAQFVLNVETSMMVNFWPEMTPAQERKTKLKKDLYQLKLKFAS